MTKPARIACDFSDSNLLNGARARCILVQRPMGSDFVVITRIASQDPAQVRFAQDNSCSRSTHSRRIEPINRSAKAFCQGEAGALVLSLMPMARNRRVTMAPKMRSRSRMR